MYRRILVSVIVLTLSACVTTAPRPVALSYLDGAHAAVARQDWEAAYRLVEDGLISSQSEISSQALNLVRNHPQMLSAAANTFTKESFSKTLANHGENRGLEIEDRRIEMYRVVATPQEYAVARTNFDSIAPFIAEKRKREEQSRHDKEIEKERVSAELPIAAKNARFFCPSKQECEKAFSLTQIFLSENSDMKIQVATDTILETYNPTDSMKVGVKAVKMPRKGSTAEILLTATCRDEGRESLKDWCNNKLLKIYRAYPKFMQDSML